MLSDGEPLILQEQLKAKTAGDNEAHEMDEDYINRCDIGFELMKDDIEMLRNGGCEYDMFNVDDFEKFPTVAHAFDKGHGVVVQLPEEAQTPEHSIHLIADKARKHMRELQEMDVEYQWRGYNNIPREITEFRYNPSKPDEPTLAVIVNNI